MSEPRRLGVVEVGSSCVRWLGLEFEPEQPGRPWLDGERYTFCGKALGPEGLDRASPRWQESLRAVEDGANALRARPLHAAGCFATAAVREARNREELRRDLRQAAGMEIRVLAGEEEARLTAEACLTQHPKLREHDCLVSDVGGRSTELIFAPTAARTSGTWGLLSLPLGTQALTRRYSLDGAAAPELDQMQRELSRRIDELLPRDWRELRPQAWVSTGGSALAIAVGSAGQRRDVRSEYEGWRVELSRARSLGRELAATTVAERDLRYGLGGARSEQMAAGCLLHLAIAESFGAREFIVSLYDARYGILLEMERELA